MYLLYIYSDNEIPVGNSFLIFVANGINKNKHSTFGTKNQNNPGIPFVYAFSADVNREGAHIHVAAMLNAETIPPILWFPARKPSAVVSFFVNSSPHFSVPPFR